ncbi:UvrD-helicase domain-containing protein [Bifidobacterium imperatoris]|uniref:DNA 3'-5' helicase n=1 Tax=Bifidobacterium imperatoris TaxID=2020965 RepID=A0A2N5IR31_9BIFI|nr:ATP-dependent DNA helicase [Bifidobacterium imperatoris]PLS24417.1 ATP-dependent DNA helicase [Bifidobacterium imperatoris]QSY58028.1 UvrD-helicase domain-containing protein [Bifidobacterium imperatoris]
MSAFTPSPEQAVIIDAPANEDVLVVAGAGSGKTFTMTQRIIALIHRGVAPERILGLTFTRKAAGELLDRVSAAVGDTGSQQTHASPGSSPDLAGNVSRANHAGTSWDHAFFKPAIFTYDAFFQTLVRQYGLLVGFDQNTQPLSEASALQLAIEVIDQHMDLVFSEDLGALTTVAEQVIKLSGAIGSAMIGAGCTDFEDAMNRVSRWDAAFIDVLNKNLEEESIPDSEPKVHNISKTKKDTDASWQAKLDTRAEEMHALCVYRCGELLAATRKREVLLQLVRAYTQAKRERNMAEFSDFTIAAYQLIERFPSIGEQTRRRYSHVLLDEYQDTSTTQAALIAALFHPDDDHRCAVNAVGDPFQSIYAWRGASPGAFRMFQHDFHMPSESRPFPLSVTRRNSRIVLEAANDLTLPLRSRPSRPSSSLMREVDVSSLQALDNAPEGTLGVLGFETGGQEIDAVVRFCKHAVRQYGQHEHDQAHVAVLFRSKIPMPLYQEALEQAGLTTFVVGYSALLERPEIRDIMALLHVASDRTDTQALMRLLATPRFNLSAADLTALARIAEELNTQQRFRALVEAGLVSADTPASQQAAVVREHRDQVANAVFVPDLLLHDDLASNLGRLSKHGQQGVMQAAQAVQQVQHAVGRPLAEVVRVAIEALNLDIDTVVAHAVRGDGRLDPTVARMPMNSIVDLVDTYAQEIAADQTPTLRGFMAWTDYLSSVQDEAANLPDAPVDVELMTVHQSKGLEWDAVAVVGMTQGGFPSNQGDHLTVTLEEGHEGGMEQGQWQAPEYHETANSWLTKPIAVPAPMRADADILPRFPHDADINADPIAALQSLEGVEAIDDEAFGSLRDIGDGVEDSDRSAWYLTQTEEYGRRLHADERRLAYVALTRARNDVLMTYSVHANAPSRDPSAVKKGAKKSAPSNFWMEVHDALHAHPHAVSAEQCVSQLEDKAVLVTQQGDAIAAPQGFFAGDAAREYCEAVVADAWRTPLEHGAENNDLWWPSLLSPDIRQRLNHGVDSVHQAIAKAEQTLTASGKTATLICGPLSQRAQLLADDADLMSSDESSAILDDMVKAKAQRILAAGRQNVTGLQARVGGMSEREERDYWRYVVRPVPRISSPAAQEGTRFHDWAERFVNAGNPMGRSEHGLSLETGTYLDEYTGQYGDEYRGVAVPEEGHLPIWAKRLAQSHWAQRVPIWAERSIVVNVPGIGIVNGKLDAVFAGGLNLEDTSKQFTVVDWKTGKRPIKPEEVERKLAQLDMYRLLLSVVEGVELESIDATLYYVSEPKEGLREIHARGKNKQEILTELSSGIPEQSDND